MTVCYCHFSLQYVTIKVHFFKEQYITVYLALNESFKAPIKADTMIEFLNKAEKARKNIPVNQNPLHDEFQVCSEH